MAFPVLRNSLSFFLLVFIGCTPLLGGGSAVTSSLKNRGPISIDPQNPYLAANQFLREQTESSKELAGFLNLKGYPSSLELKESAFSPLELIFYYATAEERYDLTKSDNSWLITGPFREKDATLPPPPLETAPVSSPLKKGTPVPVPTFKSPSGFSSPEPSHPSEAIPTPTAVPPEPVKPVKVKSALETSRPEPALSAAAEEEEPLAEISPRGDLVHYVTMQGETLSIIARWYTNDRSNAGKLGRLNRLKSSNDLAIGDTIVIPSYMIKNKVRLTEESLAKVQATALSEMQKNR